MVDIAAKPHASAPSYRPDVDGLRALAVVPVVLYHANIAPFGGGFVGVDVFFVISGFLITSLISGEMSRGTFSLANFYLRRVRRIFPALFVVLAFCAGAGWLLLMPSDLDALGSSVIATVLFCSNVLFWRRSGYFEAPAEAQPLLHTWSLGIEEQFYLVYPLLLLAIGRYLPSRRKAIVVSLCIASFVLNVVLVRHYPRAAFYLAPSRIWELLIGAALALGVLAPPRNAALSLGAGLLGVALIGAAVFGLDSGSTFPGFAALLPAVGAAAVIWAGTGPSNAVTQALASRKTVYVGKISYSLYLWHFPLLAFASYAMTNGPSLGVRITLIALSFALAALSYHVVEQPVRQGRGIFANRRTVFSGAAGAIALFAGLGWYTHRAGEFPALNDGNAQAKLATTNANNDWDAKCRYSATSVLAEDDRCIIGIRGGIPQFALWGDSHAAAMQPAVNLAAANAHLTGFYLGQSRCIPMLGIERADVPDCRQVNDAVMAYLLAHPSIRTVILAGRWGLWAEGARYRHERGVDVIVRFPAGSPDNRAAFAAGTEKAVAALTAAHKQVVLVGPVPEVGYEVPRALYLRARGIGDVVEIRPTFAEFLSRQNFVMAHFNQLVRKYHVQVVWPHHVLCDSHFCQVEANGVPLYRDGHHLNGYGARLTTTIFDPVMRAMDAPTSSRTAR